jgi:excinuclease UvrABC helicase subunit UvrB
MKIKFLKAGDTMREIDNNLKGVNFQGITHKAVTEESSQPQTPAPTQEAKQIDDLSKMPAAFLGKSQVANNSTEADMQFLMKNYEKVEKLNEQFDAYAQKFGYEKAAQMLDELTPSK